MGENSLRFYKTVYHYEVLSNEPLGDLSLGLLYQRCYDGDCSGLMVRIDQSEITEADMIVHCERQASDPEFFGITDHEPEEDGNCPWGVSAITEMEGLMESAEYKKDFIALHLGEDDEGEVVQECGTIEELLEHLETRMRDVWNTHVGRKEGEKPRYVMSYQFVVEQLQARYGGVIDKRMGKKWGDDLALAQAIESGADKEPN